jgi:hypothetical protein
MKKEENQYISLAEAAKMTNYSQDYISLLCRQGKLRAEKLGRNWVTTKEWVYSYVDNTNGRGESKVPVRVNSAAKEEAVASGAKGHGATQHKKPALMGQAVMEGALFCLACLIWLVNVYMIVNYVQKAYYGNSPAQTNAATMNVTSRMTTAQQQPTVTDTNTAPEVTTSSSEVSSIIAFEKETDSSVIAAETSTIQAQFMEDVDVDLYKGFAIVNPKSDPNKKFLYMLTKG